MAGTKIRIEVIRAAKQGDRDAMQAIVRHYDPLIRRMATVTCYDSAGCPHTTVNELIRDQIISDLMIQIFYKYEIGGKAKRNDDCTGRNTE